MPEQAEEEHPPLPLSPTKRRRLSKGPAAAHASPASPCVVSIAPESAPEPTDAAPGKALEAHVGPEAKPEDVPAVLHVVAPDQPSEVALEPPIPLLSPQDEFGNLAEALDAVTGPVVSPAPKRDDQNVEHASGESTSVVPKASVSLEAPLSVEQASGESTPAVDHDVAQAPSEFAPTATDAPLLHETPLSLEQVSCKSALGVDQIGGCEESGAKLAGKKNQSNKRGPKPQAGGVPKPPKKAKPPLITEHAVIDAFEGLPPVLQDCGVEDDDAGNTIVTTDEPKKKKKDKKEKKSTKGTKDDTAECSTPPPPPRREKASATGDDLEGALQTALARGPVGLDREEGCDGAMGMEVEDGADGLETDVLSPIELREKITESLLGSGGAQTLQEFEEEIGQSVDLSEQPGLWVDKSLDMVGLTGELLVHELESPSFNMAALEESYWELGQKVLSAGLEFDQDDAFRDLFDDLLAKREELKEAREHRKATKRKGPLNFRWAPMTEGEEYLYDAVVVFVQANSRDNPWVPLSSILDDLSVRRKKQAMPHGCATFWEWLAERFRDDMHMVTDGTELLVHYTGHGAVLKPNAEEDEERRRLLVGHVFDALTRHARDYPASDGLPIPELERRPEVMKLKFPFGAIRAALGRVPQTFELFENRLGWSVRLRVSALAPGGYHRGGKITTSTRTYRPEPLAPPPPPMPMRRGSGPPGALGRGPAPYSHASAASQGTSGITVGQWQAQQQALFPNAAPLHEGWLRAKSRSTGKLFFVNQLTGQTQFEVPRHAAGASSLQPVAPAPMTPTTIRTAPEPSRVVAPAGMSVGLPHPGTVTKAPAATRNVPRRGGVPAPFVPPRE